MNCKLPIIFVLNVTYNLDPILKVLKNLLLISRRQLVRRLTSSRGRRLLRGWRRPLVRRVQLKRGSRKRRGESVRRIWSKTFKVKTFLYLFEINWLSWEFLKLIIWIIFHSISQDILLYKNNIGKFFTVDIRLAWLFNIDVTYFLNYLPTKNIYQ